MTDETEIYNEIAKRYGSSNRVVEKITEYVVGLLNTPDAECTWTEEPEYEFWGTSCGQLFILNCGSPHDNNFKYCPFCGREIVEEK